jgi:dienelactone hydrolase
MTMDDTRRPLSHLLSRRPNAVPGGLFGDLEDFLQGFRCSAPLDLNAERWRRANGSGSFAEWQQIARAFTLECLHYEPGPVDLQAKVLDVQPRDGFIAEKIAFHTAPWSRVEGWFLRPDGPGPFPAIVYFHSWGGPMILGKDRLVSRGKHHPRLQEFFERGGSKPFSAEILARRGYAVIVIDAFHFGSRLPWGAMITSPREKPCLPPRLDPMDLSIEEFDRVNQQAVELLFIAMRYLNWAGTTWAGVNFWDDSRCVDYLVSRPEVDPLRIGCVGSSGGGWRAHFLAGLDPRIAASVSSCWTTTGDWNHMYGFTGTIGTFCMVPGLWRRLDLPDIALLAAPAASMVISGQDDKLFPPEGMEEAARQIQAGFEWAGVPEKFRFHYPKKPHCFDDENQEAAWAWFDQWLKPNEKHP